jgi:hypothetical protein
VASGGSRPAGSESHTLAWLDSRESDCDVFALFDELLRAQKEAGLTQAEVAERMVT